MLRGGLRTSGNCRARSAPGCLRWRPDIGNALIHRSAAAPPDSTSIYPFRSERLAVAPKSIIAAENSSSGLRYLSWLRVKLQGAPPARS